MKKLEAEGKAIPSGSTVLMGMLGLGGLRTWEKIQGAQNQH